MPAIVFPPNPQDGDEFLANGRTWTYDSSVPAWRPKADVTVPPELGGTFVAHSAVQVLDATSKRRAQSNIGLAKNVSDAAVPPTVDDDVTEGFGPLSLWCDAVGGEVYVCVDNAAGAAVWIRATITLAEVQALIDSNPGIPVTPFDAGTVGGVMEVNFDMTDSTFQRALVTDDMTLGAPVNGTEGQSLRLWLTASGGSWNLTFAGNIRIPSESNLTQPKVLGDQNLYILQLQYTGSFWMLVSLVGGYSPAGGG